MADCMSCVKWCMSTRRAPPQAPSEQRVELNVGGRRFTSFRHVLSKYPSSELASWISGWPDENGSYFIDRDPQSFVFVLSFLHDGPERFMPPEHARDRVSLRREATQLGIQELVLLLDRKSAGQPEAVGVPPRADLSSPGRLEPPTYVGAPIPSNEAERIELLHSLDILYTSPGHHYDCIANIVAALLDMPIVLVSLVSSGEQWFKAKCGLDADTTLRNTSFCAFSFKPEDPKLASVLVIEDAWRDPRVSDNPLVIGEPFIRFYAGCPLVTSSGMRLGALCCIDRVPRSFSFAQSQLLVNFGHLTTQSLESSQLQDGIGVGGSAGGGLPQQVGSGLLDFTAGNLREQRMREGLKEMVLLIWARPESDHWLLMYANQAWTMATGLVVKPPKTFPGTVEIVNTQSGNAAILGTSLWDHMRCFSNEDSEKISALCRVLDTILNQAPHSTGGTDIDAPTCALSAIIRRPTGEETKVLCRFSPADKPLDVAASTTRPTMQASSDKTPVSLYGFPPGLFYFVVIVEQRSNAGANPFHRKVSPSNCSTGSSEVSDPFSDKRMGLTKLRRCISEKAGSGEASRDDPRRRGVEPPPFPYADIRILRLVGEGTFSKVYFGIWKGTSVAVKVLSKKPPAQQKPTLSPDIEAELSSLVSHPNLVKTYQYGPQHASSNQMETGPGVSLVVDRGGVGVWILQEWCDRGTLQDYCTVPKVDSADILETCDIMLDIGMGIAYLHDWNIIHGDLTPRNVLLTSQPSKRGYTCKVSDFGRARICDEETQEIKTQALGTVTHMPPELFVSNLKLASLSPKADVYAVGVNMYQVVTAKSPFAGLSPPQVVLRVAGAARRGTSLRLPEDVPPCLKRVHLRTVSREPKVRPSAKQFVEEIDEVKQELSARAAQSHTFA